MVLGVYLIGINISNACSILYYIDSHTGKIYVANHEDYWYDVKAYIQIMPETKNKRARLWFGWDQFAQGGINAAGLFFDGAVTPRQDIPEGYGSPKSNLGDEILASCSTVAEALALLESRKIALKDAHMMFGDSTGNAVVVEWVAGEKKIISITEHQLMMTNFLLSDTTQGNYPCYRYAAMNKRVLELQHQDTAVSLLQVGNVLGGAAQPPVEDESGKVGGTVYSTFINITDMEFVLVYKLDNTKFTKLNLRQEFATGKKKKIGLK